MLLQQQQQPVGDLLSTFAQLQLKRKSGQISQGQTVNT
jgi:hypothetical protein